MSRPLPHPSELSGPYWQAARRHELVIQHCSTCQHYVFYPRPVCTSCGGRDLGWAPVSGRGWVYSFTIARRATHPKLTEQLPYVIALIELLEGPRMTSTVVGPDRLEVSVGAPVHVAFEDHADVSVPVFELVQGVL